LRRSPSAQVATEGVTYTKMVLETQLRWLFREQPTEDYGIDAHTEVVDGEEVTGRLLALQIKSGSSWFKELAPGGWWFRPDAEHIHYWLDHSLPVIAVLYDPEGEKCYWQAVTRATLEQTSKGGWKLLIPERHQLNASAADQLREAAKGAPYELRLRQLQLAKPWMTLLENGNRLVVDVEEWVNKSSGRSAVSLGIDNEDGGPIENLATWGVLKGLATYADILPQLFAWAALHVHAETYDDAEYDEYLANCTYVDREGDRVVMEDLDSWRSGRSTEALRPYVREAEEVDHWRLELVLNDLGKAFLKVDEFAAQGRPMLT
jgi:hypothetical protein